MSAWLQEHIYASFLPIPRLVSNGFIKTQNFIYYYGLLYAIALIPFKRVLVFGSTFWFGLVCKTSFCRMTLLYLSRCKSLFHSVLHQLSGNWWRWSLCTVFGWWSVRILCHFSFLTLHSEQMKILLYQFGNSFNFLLKIEWIKFCFGNIWEPLPCTLQRLRSEGSWGVQKPTISHSLIVVHLLFLTQCHVHNERTKSITCSSNAVVGLCICFTVWGNAFFKPNRGTWDLPMVNAPHAHCNNWPPC